ncbi:hypothetical protein Nmel_017194, partial [Mimus melanotis]
AALLLPGAARSGGRGRARRRFPTGETRLLGSLAACWVSPLPTRTRGFGKFCLLRIFL